MMLKKSYKEKYLRYLRSKAWHSKRVQVLKRDNYKCIVCGCEKKLQVHHLTYKRVFNEDIEDLITVCSLHHKYFFHKDKHLSKYLFIFDTIFIIILYATLICFKFFSVYNAP